MAKVSIHSSLANNSLIETYAKDLSLFLNEISLSGMIGRNGGFERNMAAQSSGVMKVHVKIPEEPAWPASVRQISRTSDNYLVYARHWDYSDYFQIIALISPDAHKMADRLLPKIIDIADKDFHDLNLSQLNALTTY